MSHDTHTNDKPRYAEPVEPAPADTSAANADESGTTQPQEQHPFWSKTKEALRRFLRLFQRGNSSLARYLLRLSAFALLILALFWAIDRITPKGDLFGFLKPKPLEIEQTQNLVVSIRNIAELHSATFCGEYLVRNSKGKKGSDKKDSIYLIVKSRVHAGFDLSKIQPDDIRIHHDTLDITIPPAQILDAIINPSDIEIFDETGTWTDAQIQQTICMGRADIQRIALSHGILTKAQESGILLLENIFRTLGYAHVSITIARTPSK